jgi:hypothetical protein
MLRCGRVRRKFQAISMKSKLFRKDFVLVTFQATDAFSDGYVVLQNPRSVVYHGVPFIEGVHSDDSVEYIRGRRMLIPLASVTTITEFDNTTEIFPNRRKKKNHKRLRAS